MSAWLLLAGLLGAWTPGDTLRVPFGPALTLSEKVGEGSFVEVWRAEERLGDRAPQRHTVRLFKESPNAEHLAEISRITEGAQHLIRTQVPRRFVTQDPSGTYHVHIVQVLEDASGDLFKVIPTEFRLKPTPSGADFDADQNVRRKKLKELVHDLVAAMAELHGLGFVHGDIHPGNVLMVNGRAKLGDLDGMVRFGMIAGVHTPEYMPPEFRFEPARPAMDYWEAAITWLEAADGENPVNGFLRHARTGEGPYAHQTDLLEDINYRRRFRAYVERRVKRLRLDPEMSGAILDGLIYSPRHREQAMAQRFPALRAALGAEAVSCQRRVIREKLF